MVLVLVLVLMLVLVLVIDLMSDERSSGRKMSKRGSSAEGSNLRWWEKWCRAPLRRDRLAQILLERSSSRLRAATVYMGGWSFFQPPEPTAPRPTVASVLGASLSTLG